LRQHLVEVSSSGPRFFSLPDAPAGTAGAKAGSTAGAAAVSFTGAEGQRSPDQASAPALRSASSGARSGCGSIWYVWRPLPFGTGEVSSSGPRFFSLPDAPAGTAGAKAGSTAGDITHTSRGAKKMQRAKNIQSEILKQSAEDEQARDVCVMSTASNVIVAV
jgi:hypothetical protein